MPYKTFKPNHLERRYRTYFAVLYVPKDVQHIIGKSKFFETTGTSDHKIALTVAALKVIKWKAEIASARTKTDDPILDSAIELNRMLKTSPAHLVKDVIEEETARISHQTGQLASSVFHSVATGKRKPLKNYIDQWVSNEERRGLEQKTISQMKSDVSILVEYLPTADLLVYEHTNLWIKLIAQKGELSAASVTRIIGSCRNFFKYLKFIEEVPEDANEPFIVPKEFKLSKKKNSKGLNKTESWLPFETSEVINIHKTALENEDYQLAQLIVLASFTGARIEEICSLKREHVNLKSKSIRIVDAKTEAGERVIPIHPFALTTINNLLSENDDYLMPNLSTSKYGDRSNAIGKRFGRLKSKMGFSKRYVFHSIRKTFTTQLENAGILENVTADIVGHEKPRLTYGLYSGGTNLEVKRKAISKVKFKFATTPKVTLQKFATNTSRSIEKPTRTSSKPVR